MQSIRLLRCAAVHSNKTRKQWNTQISERARIESPLEHTCSKVRLVSVLPSPNHASSTAYASLALCGCPIPAFLFLLWAPGGPCRSSNVSGPLLFLVVRPNGRKILLSLISNAQASLRHGCRLHCLVAPSEPTLHDFSNSPHGTSTPCISSCVFSALLPCPLRPRHRLTTPRYRLSCQQTVQLDEHCLSCALAQSDQACHFASQSTFTLFRRF